MITDFHNITDSEFISLCNQMDQKVTVSDKVQFYISKEGVYRFGSPSFKTRPIDGVEYRFGISTKDPDDKKEVVQWGFDNWAPILYDNMVSEFASRRSRCNTDQEVRALYDQELIELGDRLLSIKTKRGYDAERSKKVPELYLHDSYHDVREYCNGIAISRFLNELGRQIEELNSDTTSVGSDDNGSVTSGLKKQHKFVLLCELGIIDHLDAQFNFRQMKQADQVKLLCLILGENFNESKDTFKGCLRDYQSPTTKSKILSPNALNTVHAALVQVGLPNFTER